ncbi:MAG: dTDP-glucose 4,6-dehydratase [Verrucomicrobiota bacterium]|nr:dTDP-glucose 4,6-dehydratase [Verrucomicrobiota bacterium]
MKLLVTGGAGFIGSNYVHHVLKNTQDDVVVLDKLTYAGNKENLGAFKGSLRLSFVQGDIGDAILVPQILNAHGIDAIVNFAAESHVDRSITSPGEFIQTNVVGTFELLQSARAYYDSQPLKKETFRFLHVSTDEVYGSLGPNDAAFSESTPYSPNSPYSASKAASDHLVRAYFHTYHLPVLTTNCSNNYGPWQFPEKLIPLMILNALDGKKLPVYGDGLNIRDWLYVEDHCKAIHMLLTQGKPGETYNVGGLCEKTNLELVHTLCHLLDELVPNSPFVPHKNLIHFVTDRPGHDRRYAIDCRKIQLETGWQPSETLETGLRKTIQWYLDNREWREHISSNKYNRERLGLNQPKK